METKIYTISDFYDAYHRVLFSGDYDAALQWVYDHSEKIRGRPYFRRWAEDGAEFFDISSTVVKLAPLHKIDAATSKEILDKADETCYNIYDNKERKKNSMDFIAVLNNLCDILDQSIDIARENVEGVEISVNDYKIQPPLDEKDDAILFIDFSWWYKTNKPIGACVLLNLKNVDPNFIAGMIVGTIDATDAANV